MWVLSGTTYVGHLEQYQHFESALMVDDNDDDYSVLLLMMIKSLFVPDF